MMPERVDLEAFINGDSVTLVIDIVDSADGTTPHPLTGWVFKLTAKHNKYQSDAQAVIAKSVVTDNSSQVIFTFTHDDTNQLLQSAYDYDIQVSNPEQDTVSTPFMGKLRIKRGVTEDA